ncbi:MAG: hypothetical protein E4H27_10165 [Anaerolineales bacterium]|nr:MAG: hypothetical protein E4H27_10165 [Anaerolineales bacterium]
MKNMSSPNNNFGDGAAVIDAYCHVGLPRFGSAEDALAVADQWRITNSVLVLGPEVPDYHTLFHAMQGFGERVRCVGIPFGETQDQITESVLLQLRAGVLGLRVEPRILLAYPSIVQDVGEQGRWLYAIGASDSSEVMLKLLSWLDDYPDAHIAAPHFLRPHPLFEEGRDHGLLRVLVSHPRFHPIFSRHGGMGSREPYPHKDFTSWVEQVIETSGWENVLWGSEYPVYTWRDETMETCLQWLPSLLENMTPSQRDAVLRHNAQRLIFDQPVPERETVQVPGWIETQFNRDRVVPLFPDGLRIPMQLYRVLHHRYVQALKQDPKVRLTAFIMQMLQDTNG